MSIFDILADTVLIFECYSMNIWLGYRLERTSHLNYLKFAVANVDIDKTIVEDKDHLDCLKNVRKYKYSRPPIRKMQLAHKATFFHILKIGFQINLKTDEPRPYWHICLSVSQLIVCYCGGLTNKHTFNMWQNQHSTWFFFSPDLKITVIQFGINT